MPGIETFPRPGAAATTFNGVADHPANGFSDRQASSDDFNSVMQATLDSRGQKSPDKNPLRAPKNSPADQPLKSETSTTASNGVDSGDRMLSRKTDGNEKQVAKDKDDDKISPDQNPWIVNPNEQLPVFLSLPLILSGSFLGGVDNRLKGENPGGGKVSAIPTDLAEISASALQASGEKGTPGSSTLAGNLALAGITENNGLAKSLTPVKSTAKTDATTPDLLAKSVPAPATGGPPADSKPIFPPELTGAPPDKDAKALEMGAVSPLEKVAEDAGTGVAIEGLQMKNQQKTNKVAGPDVKVLPVGDNGEARQQNLPSQMLVTPVRAAENSGTDLNFSFSNGNQNAPLVENTPLLNVIDLPSLADARMRALDRTHDMMSLHAMRLVESKSDVLSVIIKPAVGTELSLELRQYPDGVEAHATLTRGDHQFLSQHWGELQERLEQRGIRLAPLGGETNFSADDNRQFQQQQASQEEVAQQASAFAEFATMEAPRGASARLALVHEGWESWA